jgi:putative transposase
METPFESSPHRKHCKRYNIPRHAHYLTFSCFHRQPFLSKDRTRLWLAQAIRAARHKHALYIFAYVFMPEHVHLLIRPKREHYDIADILESIKTPVARRACAFIKRTTPDFLPRMRTATDDTLHFWQAGGGYDRNIFTEEELFEKIHYIHQNPVRRKLVSHASDWHWSSAADYAQLRAGTIPVDIRTW